MFVGVHVLDPETMNRSDGVALVPADLSLDSFVWDGFYASEANVHVLLFTGESADNSRIWVYRHGT